MQYTSRYSNVPRILKVDSDCNTANSINQGVSIWPWFPVAKTKSFCYIWFGHILPHEQNTKIKGWATNRNSATATHNWPFSQARWARRAMVWMVLPSPISSARMPLSRFSCMVASQSRPTCWYSRRLCFSRKGTLVFTCKVQGCHTAESTAEL